MKIALTQQRLREVLNYDPETGVFTWRVSLSNKAGVGEQAGTRTKRGCTAIGIDRHQYKAHHLAWFWMVGSWPMQEIDRRDTDPTNNRWVNLRQVSRQVNSQNHRRPRTNNKCGFLGVHKCAKTGRYRACITLNGKPKQLGRFETPELAHAAYVAAKRQMHAGCTL